MTNTVLPEIKGAAEQISAALSSRIACAPIKDAIAPHGMAGAYAVQEILTKQGLLQGRRLIGRKIGLTARSVQQQLGVDQPDYGMLFADMEYAEDCEVPLQRFISPRVEAEIAFVLGREVIDPELTLGELIRAIDFALPAIEIVDSRIADWQISILDTVADNASSGAYVLGGAPKRIDGIDMRLCGMALETKGEPVSVGCGAACLGNPLSAALWLSRTMASAERPLKAGDIILSGALGPMVPVRPGASYRARINGLGSVNVHFSDD